MSEKPNLGDVALARVLPLMYEELKRIARGYMRRERRDHTLQPTALLNEAYLRLANQREVDWGNRAQVIGMAAQMMRRVLVNYARDRVAHKRGGGAVKVTLSLAEQVAEQSEVDPIVVDRLLDQLAKIDQRKSQIVEYKFFCGLNTQEIADAMGVSVATVERDWTFSRAWLAKQLADELKVV